VIWDEMAVVGRIARPHGIRGQMVVNPETDFPEERFTIGAKLFVLRDGRVDPFTVTASRLQQGRPIVALDGIDDVDTARELAGLELRVPVDSLAELPEGMFYRHDLVGCVVSTVNGRELGSVSKVEGEAGNTRLVVQTATGSELLVPLAVDICTTIDPAARKIVIAPPDGLIELNEPRR
jgi:16S rRNA processing protein RimM